MLLPDTRSQQVIGTQQPWMWNTLGCASQEKGHVKCLRKKRKGEEERAWRPSMGVEAVGLDALGS